jgi:hypothetical protein
MLGRVLTAVALISLHGAANAWFFFIPIGGIQSAIQGDHCVSESAKQGDRITANGREWIVVSTSGTSSRCAHTPQWPVIAKLDPILTDAELRAEHSVCVSRGLVVGSKTRIPGLGDVEVKSIGGNNCNQEVAPISAVVTRIQNPNAKPAPFKAEPANALTNASSPESVQPPSTLCVRLGAGPGDRLETPEGTVEVVRVLKQGTCLSPSRPLMAEVRPAADVAVHPTLVTAPDTPKKTVVERLRELKQLRDENLVTESVYESKQKEILSGQ